MTIGAGTVWRIRTGGNAANGAGYDSTISGAGTDYTQQDSAQLTLSDCATSGAGSTTLTSATGGFTSAMVGNAIRIASGTNFQAGYYFITAYTDTNTVTVDRTPSSGGAGSSGAGRVGGAARQLSDALGTACVPGNTIYVRATAGNASSYPTSSPDYTIGSSFTPSSGSAAVGLIKWIGENGVPTIQTPGLAMNGFSFVHFEGLYFYANGNTSGTIGILSAGANTVILDCIFNTNSQSSQHGIYFSTGQGTAIGNEVYSGSTSPTSATNTGIVATGNGCLIMGNKVRYMRGKGIDCTGSGCDVLFNTVYGCVDNGISTAVASTVVCHILNNTINGNSGHGIAVSGSNGAAWCVIANNVITNHTGSGKHGISVTTSSSDPRKLAWRGNIFNGNTTDYSNVSADATDQAIDPDYVNAAGGDFTPQEATLEGAAYPQYVGAPTGGANNYLWPGSLQPQDAGGGGGGGGGKLVGDGGGLIG